MTEIIAVLRVKNEARWIREVLEAIRWTKAIYLMDDHSTDATREIARECGAVVMESPFDTFDEARDKEWLVTEAAKHHARGSWVLMQDGDEILEKNGRQLIEHCVANSGPTPSFSLAIKFLWGSRETYRVDGVYDKFRRPSLFILNGCYSFRKSGVNGNLHPRCVPAALLQGCRPCFASLLHLGYMDKEDRIRKWKFYNSMDPVNVTEGYDALHPERGSYPHIVQGDIPEVPANVRLRHSGPLELRSL